MGMVEIHIGVNGMMDVRCMKMQCFMGRALNAITLEGSARRVCHTLRCFTVAKNNYSSIFKGLTLELTQDTFAKSFRK